MFIRAKKAKLFTYLQIVENERQEGKVVQRVLLNLGRLDVLQQSGQLDSILLSGIRFSENIAVLDAYKSGEATTTSTKRIGPALLFEKIWRECGIGQSIQRVVTDRRFKFSIERSIFLTVLHRLFAPGSDRAAEKWRRDYAIDGCDKLGLHHLYRAMGWLGHRLADENQKDAMPGMARCIKDEIEEDLLRTPAICLPICSWFSLIPPRSTSKDWVASPWASTATPRITVPICARSWSASC